MSVCNLCYPLPETNSKKKTPANSPNLPLVFFFGGISIWCICQSVIFVEHVDTFFSERHDIHIFVSPNACCVFGLVSLNILRQFFEIAHHFWLVPPPVTTNEATTAVHPQDVDPAERIWGQSTDEEKEDLSKLKAQIQPMDQLPKSTRKMIIFVRSVQHWWENWGPARLNPHIPNDSLFWMFCF